MPNSRIAFLTPAVRRYANNPKKFIDDAEKIKRMYETGDYRPLLKMFEVPEFLQRKNIRLMPVSFFDNDQEKETCSLEERELQLSALKTAIGIGAAFAGDLPIEEEAETAPSGGSLFRKYQFPPGSKLSSTFSLGRRAFPPSSVAQTAKATIFKSDYKNGGDLVKGAAFRAKTVGFNRVMNMLVPLQMPEIGMRRMSLMRNWNYDSSWAVDDIDLETAYNTPSKDGFDFSESGLISGGIGRKTYVPNNQYASYSVTNLNKLLNMSIKMSLVQLKGNRSLFTQGAGVDNKKYIDPRAPLRVALGAMPANNKVDDDFTAHAGEASTNHKIWGFTNAECERFIGAYTAETVTPYTLQSSPVFEDNFHIIKSINFNIGPGSTRELNLNRFGSTCYQNMGNLDVITGTSAETRMNYSPQERIFVLVEVKGAANQSYYRYNNDPTLTEEERCTWSVAKSAPVQFTHSLKMDVELPLKQNINTDSMYEGGIVYKKNYMKITNETNVSATVHQPYDAVYRDESWIPSEEDGYIFPIATNLEMSSARPRVRR